MMTKVSELIIGLVVLIGLLCAFLLGTRLSTPLQSPALLVLSVAGGLSVLMVFTKRQMPSVRLLVFFSVVWLYFILRAYFSPVGDLGSEDLFLIFSAGLLYVTTGYNLGTASMRMGLAYTVILALSLNVISGLIQYTGGEGIWPQQFFTDVERPGGSVITGLYGYRGSFANFTSIAGVLTLALAIWGKFHIVVRAVFFSGTALSFFLISQANSRSAILALIVGVLVMIVCLFIYAKGQHDKYQKKLALSAGVLTLLLIIGGGIATVSVFSNRAAEDVSVADVVFADSARGSYWPMAIDQVSLDPILGSGSRSFSYLCDRFWNPNLRVQSNSPEFVHNEYLQTLTDYGAIGLLMILVFVCAHLVIGFKRLRVISDLMASKDLKSSNAIALCVAGMAGISIMAVHVIFDFRTHLQANLLLVSCCMVWVLPVKSLKAESSSVSQKLGILVSTLCLVAVVVFSTSLGLQEARVAKILSSQKMTEETGSWDVQAAYSIDRISALEQAIEIRPTFRRHLKLGALYYYQALNFSEPEGRKEVLQRSLFQYLEANKRHPYNPVAVINIARILAANKEYERSGAYFEQALSLGNKRADIWYDVRYYWARMLCERAADLYSLGEIEKADAMYKAGAVKLAEIEHTRAKKEIWKLEAQIVATRLQLLSGLNKFDAADMELQRFTLHNKERRRKVFKIGDKVLANYYLSKGNYLWYQRKPEAAMSQFISAKNYYLKHKRLVKGEVDELWENGYKMAEDSIEFMKRAGIDPAIDFEKTP